MGRGQVHPHEAEEGGGRGRLAKLARDDLDAVLDIDGSDVEAKGVAREPSYVLESSDGWSQRSCQSKQSETETHR